jgi:tRNA pseudouridine38-40 synthase
MRRPAAPAAARHLIGEHDFSDFCRNASGGSGSVRRLERLSISRQGDRIDVSARANAFAHQMVRSLVGTLVAVGEGSRDADEIPAVLASRDRSRAAQIAPPHGITLVRVLYGRRTGRRTRSKA